MGNLTEKWQYCIIKFNIFKISYILILDKLVLVNIFKNSRKVQQIQINSLSFKNICHKQSLHL